MRVIGIDPGLTGAIVVIDDNEFRCIDMPVVEKEIDYDGICGVFLQYQGTQTFLERAIPFAMGAKSAFNYGRGFAALELAIRAMRMPVTYIEPAKWTKVMHAGIDSGLKPKFKSLIAIERQFPNIMEFIPKSSTGKLHDGVIDAILIAEYGKRMMNST